MTGVQIWVCIWMTMFFTGISVFGAWMAENSKSGEPAWRALCYGGIAGAAWTTFLFLIALLTCGGGAK